MCASTNTKAAARGKTSDSHPRKLGDWTSQPPVNMQVNPIKRRRSSTFLSSTFLKRRRTESRGFAAEACGNQTDPLPAGQWAISEFLGKTGLLGKAAPGGKRYR